MYFSTINYDTSLNAYMLETCHRCNSCIFSQNIFLPIQGSIVRCCKQSIRPNKWVLWYPLR